ncbi:hypothetical protein CEXT_235611 [Caerostris extrusa]|uniref:Beta-1,4-glucuronyltransferase 1 n=1 Tax=Caerostris extrusa TaxID=172846 RepID=A0AAV4U674_CAEEX|nr:hypothetical protein CEXT_235611 [Caerostris extrusa]
MCWKCQKHTDYETWQKEPPSQKLNVIFEVLWRDPWEPFYIGRNVAPFYDERFRQYGFNRISQAKKKILRNKSERKSGVDLHLEKKKPPSPRSHEQLENKQFVSLSTMGEDRTFFSGLNSIPPFGILVEISSSAENFMSLLFVPFF